MTCRRDPLAVVLQREGRPIAPKGRYMSPSSTPVIGNSMAGLRSARSRRLLIDSAADVAYAARALTAGGVTATAFGNFYVIVTRPAVKTVRRVNVVKGRPIHQVGSITTEASRIPAMFDWSQLLERRTAERVQALMETLYGFGPFGFRGPAAAHVPDHLTQLDGGVRTTQVIAPGSRCPSNAFFARAVAEVGAELLYITSANRSRHLTGAVEEPAHWQAAGIAADFAHVPDLVIIEHRDEGAAREAYPGFAPTSVTLLSFHALGGSPGGGAVLTVDRHGSLPISAVRHVAEPFGFDVVLGQHAQQRLQIRDYPEAAVGT